VLQRHVQVARDVRLRRQGVDQGLGEIARIGVVEPDPPGRHLAERLQQFVQLGAARQIMSVCGEVLRDQVELDRALRDQPVGLHHDVRDGPGALQPAQGRDDAERALVVAALGDLHVRRPARHRVAPRRAAVRDVVGIGDDGAVALALEDLRDARVGRGPDEVIDLGHLLLEHVRVALREASRHHQRLAATSFLQLGVLEDGVDRLLLGLPDEGAGVDQDHLRLSRLVHQLVSLVEQAAEHDFAVHPILRAAEREQVERRVCRKSGLLHPGSGGKGVSV